MTQRLAGLADLDDMVRIGLRAMPLDPQWDYRYRHRKEYPEDHEKYTKLKWRKYLENNDDTYMVRMIDMPSNENPDRTVAVAFAVWAFATSPKEADRKAEQTPLQVESDRGQHDRPDADPRRLDAFQQSMVKAKRCYMDEVFGNKQLHLQLLATDPDHQGRGAASKLCLSGLAYAARHDLVVTLFASPIGLGLYERLGFRELVVAVVQVDGEKEKLHIPGMVWKPGNK